MRIVLLGPPGAGKGTYASRLSNIWDIPHVATGDMVREEISRQTELGKTLKNYSDRGELVPNEIIINLLDRRLKRPDCKDGFILDGFPRTKEQAETLDEISNIILVINLNVPDEIIIKRLSNRLICRECGAIYNTLTLKPRKENTCDECGGELRQREDDKPEVIQERLNIYREKTAPLIEYYKKKGILKDIFCMDLMTPPEVIVDKINHVIHSLQIKGGN